MTAPIIAYERTVLVTEKDILDLKKEAIINAFPDEPLQCQGIDHAGGRAIRVVPFRNQKQVLAIIPIDVIAGADVESLQKRLTAGEFKSP